MHKMDRTGCTHIITIITKRNITELLTLFKNENCHNLLNLM